MVEAGLNFHPTENMLMVQQLAREFAEKELRPVVMKYDESQDFPFAIAAKLGELGFLGATFPEEYNGAGLSPLDFTVLVEEIVQDQLKIDFWNGERSQRLLRELDAVMNLQRTPYQVAKELLGTLTK